MAAALAATSDAYIKLSYVFIFLFSICLMDIELLLFKHKSDNYLSLNTPLSSSFIYFIRER